MPISNIATYYRPPDLRTALSLLREGRGRAVPLAGGTSLVGGPPRDVEAVVDLQDLQLDRMTLQADGGLSLGAMVTLAEMMEDETVRGYADGFLVQAARYSAGSLVRNRATLGGTLIARAATSDLVAALLALNATVTIVDSGEQSVTLDDLYRRRDYLLQPGALLTEVRLPPFAEGRRASLQRIARTPMDQPILSVAAAFSRHGGTIRDARLAAVGFGSAPACLVASQDALEGTEIGAEAFNVAIARAAEGLAIQSDHLATAEYRAAMLPILVQRALSQS
jgi:CO/xanthine dehydrogenase FAD-binding subunit